VAGGAGTAGRHWSQGRVTCFKGLALQLSFAPPCGTHLAQQQQTCSPKGSVLARGEATVWYKTGNCGTDHAPVVHAEHAPAVLEVQTVGSGLSLSSQLEQLGTITSGSSVVCYRVR